MNQETPSTADPQIVAASMPAILQPFASTIHVSRIALIAVLIVRGTILGLLASSIWSVTAPSSPWQAIFLGLLAFALSAIIGGAQHWPRSTSLSQLLTHLEMKYPKVPVSAFRLRDDVEGTTPIWQPALAASLQQLRRAERSRAWTVLNSTLPPLLALVALTQFAPGSLATNLHTAQVAFASLSKGVMFRVVDGSADQKFGDFVKLTTRQPLAVELLSENMVEVRMTILATDPTPTMELRRSLPDGSVGDTIQSFQLAEGERAGSSSDEGTRTYAISFVVSETSRLVIPSVSSSSPLADFKVRALPIPRVDLSTAVNLAEPWSDDRPLPLDIKVSADNPIAVVSLLITADKRTSRELVSRVVAEDRKELDISHSVVLEQYLESDLAEVEIVAEAIDRSLPKPLIGRSEPLRLTVASSYGRYKQTLATLRDLKKGLDEGLTKSPIASDPEWADLGTRVLKQSERSPFFDGLDRLQIQRFAGQAREAADDAKAEQMMELSSAVNSFLFEHEILDDRERDRDFFVAIRTLSRVMEQAKAQRPVAPKVVVTRLQAFLAEREKRWKARVERLAADKRPPSWPRISSEHPFAKSLDQALRADTAASGPSEQALGTLSSVVTAYRGWLEELEQAEDAARSSEDQKRQQGLANARNELRELQKRQSLVSEKLDRADQRESAELGKSWPSARMEQNTNIQATRSLEAKVRAFSPEASGRIKAAVEAMNKTLENGNGEQYPAAESFSDLSGRLLRQAERAASESQSQRQQRGRRRRTAGDNYYGQSVVGGDVEIKREYQVDKRYREDILNQVRDANVEGEDRQILDDYLREVIR